MLLSIVELCLAEDTDHLVSNFELKIFKIGEGLKKNLSIKMPDQYFQTDINWGKNHQTSK